MEWGFASIFMVRILTKSLLGGCDNSATENVNDFGLLTAAHRGTMVSLRRRLCTHVASRRRR